MDETKLQEFLDQAARAYSDGKYDEAIGFWQQILHEDPENQKAREGIRMARLLVQGPGGGGDDEVGELGLDPEGIDPDLQQKIEIGIARVRELLNGGRSQEAMEGCQILAELAPGMDSINQLQEEVSHAFEAQPFMQEHLGRARKFLAQMKGAEALAEAEKILSIDKENEEARAMIQQLTGQSAGAGEAPPPSAFQTGPEGTPAAPSPFAGHQEPLAAGPPAGPAPEKPQAPPPPDSPALASPEFDDEFQTGPQPAPGGDVPVEPAEPPAAGEGRLEMDFEEMGGAGPEAPAPSGEESAEIRELLERGRGLFAEEKYQEAVDAWSHIYAIDSGHAAAGELIDQAKVRMNEAGKKADEAYYRGVDLFEAGNLKEARTVFKKVLALQPNHADAQSYVEQIQVKIGGEEPVESIPLVAPAADAAPGEGAEPDAELAAAAAPAPALAREEVKPQPPLEERPIHVTDGPIKKPKRPSAALPPRSGSRALILVVAAVIIVGGAAAAWLFIPWGSETETPVEETAVEAPAEPLPGELSPEAGGQEGEAQPEEPAGGGRLDVVPGATQPEQPEQPPSPQEIARRVSTLLRQGRSLMTQKKYPEAKAKFEEILAMDPGNFDADDLRLQASDLAAAEMKFDRDLEAAKDAFDQRDWGGSLYKLYRLREQRRDMTILNRYIKNANYNWGIESLENFDVQNAIQHFKDAQEMAPANTEIQRALAFSERYERRRRDAAFDSFISRLRPKALNEQ